MKVLLILSDGMRPDAIADHPAIRELMKKGSYSLNARTVMPSVTLPCHMSLFHSVDPARHGITTNTYVPQVRPVSGLFEQLNQIKKCCAMYYDWENLRDLGEPGNLARSRYVNGHLYGYETADAELFEAARAELRGGGIDFAFLYLGWPDGAGHHSGWMGEEYFQAVDACCRKIARLYEELGEEYVIIATADHGGHGRSHGTDLPEDMTIPAFFLGAPFTPGKELSDVSINDIAPTIADLLGAEIPEEWEGKIIR